MISAPTAASAKAARVIPGFSAAQALNGAVPIASGWLAKVASGSRVPIVTAWPSCSEAGCDGAAYGAGSEDGGLHGWISLFSADGQVRIGVQEPTAGCDCRNGQRVRILNPRLRPNPASKARVNQRVTKSSTIFALSVRPDPDRAQPGGRDEGFGDGLEGPAGPL